MHVQLVTRQPSAHHLFRFKPEAESNRVQSRTKHHIDRHVDRAGPVSSLCSPDGRVGELIGILESLSERPIAGAGNGSVSNGTYDLTGNLSVFNLAFQEAVKSTLAAADEVAYGLSHDRYLKTLRLTYTQEIVEIGGNCR